MKLHYVADPMCSWCWGFHPVLERLESVILPNVELVWVMGGLAPDSDEPMPEATRAYVSAAWDAVEAKTGVGFNREFWTRCSPRRSTYPACRAVLAAGGQRAAAGPEMFRALQRAYYLEARNPSDASTAIELAREIGLDPDRFERDLTSPEMEDRLQADFALRRRLGVDSFPCLVLENGRRSEVLMRGYEPEATLFPRLREAGVTGR